MLWSGCRQSLLVGQVFEEIGGESSEVVESGVTVPQLSTGLGPYAGCIKVRWTDGVDEDFSYIAPNVGIVKEEWNEGGTNGWELQYIISGLSKDELLLDYGAYGLWHYDQPGGWSQLHPVVPQQIVAVDIDNDGLDELAAAFSGGGLYTYDRQNDPANRWTPIHPMVPDAMIKFNNGLAADWGDGRSLSWTQVEGGSPPSNGPGTHVGRGYRQ